MTPRRSRLVAAAAMLVFMGGLLALLSVHPRTDSIEAASVSPSNESTIDRPVSTERSTSSSIVVSRAVASAPSTVVTLPPSTALKPAAPTTTAPLATTTTAKPATTTTTAKPAAKPQTVAPPAPAAAPAPPPPPPTTAAPVSGSQSDMAFLACVKRRESGGNYGAINSGGYYGAYQFSISTWNGTAAHAGRSDLVGVRPDHASPADQDAMALHLLQWQGRGPWGGSCR